MSSEIDAACLRKWLIRISIPLVPFLILFAVGLWSARSSVRMSSARTLLLTLDTAVRLYQLQVGRFPSGDGKGSAGLMKDLAAKGPKGVSWFEAPEDLDASGNLVNPGMGTVVFYRQPGTHNPQSFDLWCEDVQGIADGINNWSK